MGLAIIVTAENTSALLEIAKRTDNSGLSQSLTARTPPPVVGPKQIGERIKTYKQYEITKTNTGVKAGGEFFDNVLEA